MVSKEYLTLMKTGMHGGSASLPVVLGLAGIKHVPARKPAMVDALYEFYQDEANLLTAWNRLNGLERDILAEYVWADGQVDKNDIKAVYAKHGQVLQKNFYAREEIDSYFPAGSPARLFFLNHTIPQPLLDWLEQQIPPLSIQYDPIEEEVVAQQADHILAYGDSFSQQFVSMIRTIGQGRLKATAATGLPTKAAVVKIQASLLHQEPLPDPDETINDIRSAEQITLIYGMFKILETAAVISSQDGQLGLGPQAGAFLQMTAANQCEYLLNAYLNSASIQEWDRIPELKIRTEYPTHLRSCRQTILQRLAECPPQVWLETSQFLGYTKKADRYFLQQAVGDLLIYHPEYRDYYVGICSWDMLEGRLIEVMLLEYLTVLGIVDTAACAMWTEDGNTLFDVPYFRITALGAHVLGISKMEEQPAPTKSGFVVQPNFEIVIREGGSRHLHQVFFDRFATLVADDAVTIYSIDFACIVKAVDSGISVQAITDYLNEHSEHPLPGNIVTQLQDWAHKSGRIRIRQVTIVETDDPLLLQELLHSKPIRKYVTSELPHAFVINGADAAKVKREIEKRNHLCDLQ